MSLATSSPNSFNTISKDISIPEDTPAEVIMPSSTILLSVMTLIDLLIAFKASIAPQWVVARFPSKIPALASNNAPVQIEEVIFASIHTYLHIHIRIDMHLFYLFISI